MTAPKVHSYLRRQWPLLTIVAVLLGLALNVWAEEGIRALLILLAAVAGCLLVISTVGWVTGSQVVKHAHREATAIETGTHPKQKELGQ